MIKKKIVHLFILSFLVLGAGCGGSQLAEDVSPIDSKIFLGEWFDYYNRALRRMKAGEYAKAEEDLRMALKLQPEESHRKRVYGVRFQSYYPHRELGIARLEQGDYKEALEQLKIARSQAETAKGNYFLNESRKIMIAREGLDARQPEIMIASGEDKILTNVKIYTLEGKVVDDTYVSAIAVADSPEYFEVAEKEKAFQARLNLREGVNRIKVMAEDLGGRWTEKEVQVELDRQGPSLSLVEARKDPDAEGQRVLLKGSVFDTQGLREVRIGGKSLRAEGQRKGIEEWFDLEEHQSWLAYELQDRTGNVSRGRINVLDEEGNILIGKAGEGRRIWIASTVDVPQAIAAGAQADKVDFDYGELKEIKKVFQEDISVGCRLRHNEGLKITKISCKGVDIPGDPAVERYFHRIVSLATGENEIPIVVEDEEGNQFDSLLKIHYEQPSRFNPDNKLRVAFYEFESEQDISLAVKNLSYEEFSQEVMSDERFNFFEREMIDKLLLEQTIGLIAETQQQTAPDLSKMEQADIILQGAIAEDPPKGYTLYLDIFDVKTGARIPPRLDVYHPQMDTRDLSYLMRGLYLKLLYLFPKVEGIVIQNRGREVITTLTEEHRIRKGMELVVFREGEPIIYNGVSYGNDEEKVGNLEVKAIRQMNSEALVLEIVEGQDVQQGDVVVTK